MWRTPRINFGSSTVFTVLYVNDICKALDDNILSFADDTSLYMSDHNMDKLFEKANKQIHDLLR